MLKKTYSMELKMVTFCLRLCLIEIVLYSFAMNVFVARTNKNVEKYIIPLCVRM